MKTHAWLFSVAMSLSSLALAQTAMNTGVTEITDPARIADIERRAQQLASRATVAPMATEHAQAHKDGMRHHKGKKMHKRAKKAKASPATPVAAGAKK